ncbi:MAG: type II toxin-antitoxin system RelB/DinJ family antitoxin [Synergistaceae bacterium]|nr:type II toxin-antitoxin system RelB/DinJ family antitoxin [Synergistaceae bacterium]
MAILQVEIEDSLRNDVIPIFNNLGIDISTAVKIFLKRVVICNGLPFRMTLPKEIYSAERGYRALLEIGEESEKKRTF